MGVLGVSVVENKADDDDGEMMEAGEKASHTLEQPNRNKDTAAVENFILFLFVFCLSSKPMGDGVLIAIYSISVF